MAATLSLDTITSSGSTITVPTGKTLAIADAGALTLGTPPIAITTGAHVTAVSAVNPLTITSGNVTGKSSYVVSYDASSGTSTVFVVNLPAPADFATTVISVVSSTAHGLGNSIVIKDSAGTEVYTLYHIGDHCTFVSDGTNTLRTGDEWVTVRGEVALTAGYTLSAYAVVDLWDAGTYSEIEDVGGCWNTSNDDFTVPFDGEFMLAGSVILNGYGTGLGIKKNGTFINAVSGADISYGNPTFGVKPYVLAKNDVMTFWATSTNATPVFMGAATAATKRTSTNWWCIRRY
jgi:hypothetical protein